MEKLYALVSVFVLDIAIVQAGPVVEFDPSIGGTAQNNNQTIGWSFDLIEPVTISAMSWFDGGNDGLALAHQVGIWDSSGQLLVSAIIPAGDVAALDGIWRIMPIEPITLGINNTYVVGGLNFASSTDRVAGGILNQEFDPRFEYTGSRFSLSGPQLQIPTLHSTGLQGLYGPGINVLPVPEPGTSSLLSMFVLVALLHRRNSVDDS